MMSGGWTASQSPPRGAVWIMRTIGERWTLTTNTELCHDTRQGQVGA